MRQFQPKNHRKEFLCTANRRDDGQISSLVCREVEAPGPNATGTWTSINNLPPTVSPPGNTAAFAFPSLMTDGSVICTMFSYPLNTRDVWKLTPDINGSYVNGSWTQLADLPLIDGEEWIPVPPVKAVLPDGRLIMLGGEYSTSDYQFTLSNKGAIYDPLTDTWTPVDPPSFFTNEFTGPIFGPPGAFNPHPIGDTSAIVLSDGTFMLSGRQCYTSALLDPVSLTWTETGFNKNPMSLNFNETMTLLPDGKVLKVNRYGGPWLDFSAPTNVYPPGNNNATSEIYDPDTGNWSFAGNTVAHLNNVPPPLPVFALPPNYDAFDLFVLTYEDGPQILRPDGTVVCWGANGNSAIYDSKKKKWSAGPKIPLTPGNEQLVAVDNPAVLLPNGNILTGYSTVRGGDISGPTYFYEFTKKNKYVAQPPALEADFTASYGYDMLMLPNGQVLVTNFNDTNVQFYTPGDQSYNPDWAPFISDVQTRLKKGKTYKITGCLFNGMSQAGNTNDDAQFATNYPLVRITNKATNHVFYCRTHDHSFMGVAAVDKEVFTYFDVPKNIEIGDSWIEVVANGIPSPKVEVTTVN